MQHEYTSLLEELIRLLRREFGDRLRAVLLFGSVARGTARPDGDVDLCLVIRDLPVSRYRHRQVLSPVLERLRQSAAYTALIGRGYSHDVAAILYTPEEIQHTKLIFLDFVEDGVVLLDDGTMRAKLDQLRARMKTLGSRKVNLEDGTYYWLLKPDVKFGEVIEL